MTIRDRLADWWWRVFMSDYTSWRQDRAFRRYKRRHPAPPCTTVHGPGDHE
jgi:hypothetical protein